jgi:hypothetical protein
MQVAKFLVGHGIPQRILDVPSQVLSTPIGPMIRQMVSLHSVGIRGL